MRARDRRGHGWHPCPSASRPAGSRPGAPGAARGARHGRRGRHGSPRAGTRPPRPRRPPRAGARGPRRRARRRAREGPEPPARRSRRCRAPRGTRTARAAPRAATSAPSIRASAPPVQTPRDKIARSGIPVHGPILTYNVVGLLMSECGSSGPSSLECRQIAELLGDYLEGTLPGQTRELLEWHIEGRSEEHTSELQSQSNLVCRLLLEKKKTKTSSI